MQEFNQDHQLLNSNANANAVQLSQKQKGESSINPPDLFAEPSVQLKEDEVSQDTSDIASADIEVDSPSAVISQAKKPDLEEEEGQSEVQLKLEHSPGEIPPPSAPNNNSNSESVATPFQLKKGKSTSSQGGHDSGDVMSKMESSFGADFSNVQINANSSDAESMGALAFAKGNQIDFAPGQYNPESRAGQELLGHELTHVVQQREGRVKPTNSVNGASINDDPRLESEADISGKKAAQGVAQKKASPQSNSISNNHPSFSLKTAPVQRNKAEEDTTPVNVDEEAIAKEFVSKGAKNENYVTDEVFYKRYPGIHRRKLVFPNNTDAETALVRDWLRIRNDVVRPILAGEEKPGIGKPGSGKPDTGKPEKEKPKNDKPKGEDPKKEEPKKGKPEKDEPKKEEPRFPDLSSLIPDLLGITPDTFNIGLDATKAVCELLRLAPGFGIITGGIAGSIQLYQDLMTSMQTGDGFLVLVTLARNTLNLINGFIGDIGWLLTCLQDLGAAITAASTAGGPLVALIALVEGFIVACNEAISVLNFLLDILMLILDTLVVVHTTLKLVGVPMSDDERAAHKNLRVGYIGNGAADLISTFLDGLDVVSLGLLHGEFIDKFIKSWKGMSFVTKFGIKAIYKLDEILAGIIIPGEVNLLQGKPEGEELEEEGDGLEEILSTFVLANQKFESLDGGAKALLDMWPTFVEQMEAKIEEMSDGREPFEVAQEMFDQALADMEMKITSMTLIQDLLASADNNILVALEEIERVESMIDEISIPEIEVPELDLGDNPIADGLEGVLEGGADLVAETLNKAIRLANEELDKIKDSLRSGIAGFKEELEYVRLVIKESQKVLSGHKVELRNFIDSTREQLASCGSFEELFDRLIGEIGKMLGIEEEFDLDTIRTEWDETKTAIAEGLKTIQEYLAGNKEQAKPKVTSDPSDSVQMKTDESADDSTDKNTSSSQGAFQMKQESSSPSISSNESLPFQLKQDESLNSISQKKEHDLPFAL